MPRDLGKYLDAKSGPETTPQHQANKFSSMTRTGTAERKRNKEREENEREREGRGGIETRNLQTRTFNPYASDKDYSFGYAADPDIIQQVISSRANFENSAQLMIQSRLKTPQITTKTNVTDSFSRSLYHNSTGMKCEVSLYHPNDFLSSFELFASSNHQVDLSHIEDVVKSVMGSHTPQWILNKFRKLSGDVAQFRLVSWEQFKEIIPIALTVTEIECTIKKQDLPSHLRTQTADQYMTSSSNHLVPYLHKSCHQYDYDLSRLDDDNYISQPASQNGTTRDLFIGTSKATRHPPGYGGHIPLNTYNKRKEEHAKGETCHANPSYLRLGSERLGSVPNYTGFIPRHTGLKGERTTGMDPRTTTGSSY